MHCLHVLPDLFFHCELEYMLLITDRYTKPHTNARTNKPHNDTVKVNSNTHAHAQSTRIHTDRQHTHTHTYTHIDNNRKRSDEYLGLTMRQPIHGSHTPPEIESAIVFSVSVAST